MDVIIYNGSESNQRIAQKKLDMDTVPYPLLKVQSTSRDHIKELLRDNARTKWIEKFGTPKLHGKPYNGNETVYT
ncbi:hypothetical protein N0V95_006755 [Ascochyta clinopodiicola]|nr:hypothetical protein N0V95_006755 [Ascochyta clinopodiicola]